MSASTSMRVQKQRENELRRLVKDVPAAIRATWGQHDYADELRARNVHLFGSMLGANADRFFRLQKVLKVPEHQPAHAPAPAPMPEHAPYVEKPAAKPEDDPLAKAWADMQARIDKECKAITGHPRFASLHKGQLNICNGYQRDRVKLARVEEIALAPDMNAFAVLIVASREGKHWIVDGQHRWLAACKRNDLDVLPCLVHDSACIADEARLYVLINLKRTAVSAIDRYRALHTSGDAVAQELASCLEALDLHVVAHANGARQLSCIGSLYSMGSHDMRQCEVVLSVTQELSTEVPIGGDLVGALAYIDRNAVDGLMNSILLLRLKKLGIHKILDMITKARTARAGQPAGLLILGEVNRGLPANKRIRLRNMVEAYDDET